MFFDIIKKTDGNFVLAYGASSENTEFYTKGVLFTLRPDLKQVGGATIISKQDEEVFDVIVREFYNGVLSVAYTCTDSRSIKSTGSRDDNRKALKYIEIGRDGKVKVRSIDKQIEKYELVDLIRPQNVDDILAFYNINNAFPFNSGDLGVLEKAGENWYFNVFTSKLLRKLPQTFMAKNIVENSFQVEELGAQKVLLFFKTLEQDMYRFRAIIYGKRFCIGNFLILSNSENTLFHEPNKKRQQLKDKNCNYQNGTFQ